MLAQLPDLLMLYGPAAVVLFTLLAAFGLPSPASLTLIVAGALSLLGELDYATVVAAGMIGTVTGDHLAYGLARGAAGRLDRFGPMQRLGPARRLVERRGTFGVFLSRFVFPTLLTPTTNYVAGISRLPLRRFTPAVIAGELVYVLLLTWLGRMFSAQVPQVHRVANTASLLAFLLLVGLVCAAILLRALFRRTRNAQGD